MKTQTRYSQWFIAALLFAVAMNFTACSSTTTNPPGTSYQVTTLVADTAGYGAARIDANLQNAWGIAVNPGTGYFWVTSNHGSSTTIYDASGIQKLPSITIGSRDSLTGGEPTGVIYNSTADFALPVGGASLFIFAGEDGTISAWNPLAGMLRVYKNPSPDAVYKGIALGSSGGKNYLYVTNFREGKVEVYEKNFNLVGSFAFSDPSIPAGFAPFGIKNIGGKLYVTYAMHKGPDNEDDQAGAGFGYVSIFNTDGTLVKRFASGGNLNSPWGMAMAPDGFTDIKGDILIGNFGDGAINAFDLNGNFVTKLNDDNGNAIKIEGLWEIYTYDATHLYFAAGPEDEKHGTFGYVMMK